MIYLLTLGWSWFAGAFALGAIVGFLTFSRAPGAAFSGGWVLVLGALALTGAGAVSWTQLLAGREGALLDIGLLAGLAYAAGLPFGGAVKSLGGPAGKKRPRDLSPLVAPPPRAQPLQPMESPQPAPALTPALMAAASTPALEAVAAPVGDETPVAALVPDSALAPVAKATAPAAQTAGRANKTVPGARPETLAAPRNGVADDLSRIKGIGPKSHEKLNALGVFHYDQIASWNLDNAKWIGATIGAPGRVERDKWIQQARALTGAGTDQ